jgi:hypothetical protein
MGVFMIINTLDELAFSGKATFELSFYGTALVWRPQNA